MIRVVELVSLELARHEDAIEFAIERIFRRRPFLVGKPQLDGDGLARRDGETVVGRGLGAFGRLFTASMRPFTTKSLMPSLQNTGPGAS